MACMESANIMVLSITFLIYGVSIYLFYIMLNLNILLCKPQALLERIETSLLNDKETSI